MSDSQLPAPRREVPRWVWWILGTAFVVFALLYGSRRQAGSGRSGGSSDTAAEIDAWIMAQQFVEDRLVSPGSADFPSRHSGDVSIEQRGGVWIVESYVDSQNRFGAMLRSRFTCKLRHIGGDTWRCESLIMY